MATPENPLLTELRACADNLCAKRGWTLIKALGAGASAAVFEIATDDGVRALKVYAPRFLSGTLGRTTRQRFDIVVRNLLDHDCPNLVRCYEGDEIDGALYMVMERVPGSCLTDVLSTVPRSEVRSILTQVAAAAKYLEDRRLCHRDIKCDNIVVSSDYKKATLLDLGVIRWVDSEDGAGTDEDGQLPFVATARYSSPEYMFRLVPSSPELWRALTFYQLGGVLHDLINRQLMFEDVVQRSSQNRYLIAYSVATRIPVVRLEPEVDTDLVLLARRALQKDHTVRLASVAWLIF
ncbi:protein kinase [Micromonospora sp. STR1s_5]|nr:protein kinase [Micromonospora sp. STR1s_5]